MTKRFTKIIFIVASIAFLLPNFLLAEDLSLTCKNIIEIENGCQNLSAVDCKTTLEKCAVYYDEQSKQIATDITKTSKEKDTLNKAIATLKNKVTGLELQIRQGTIMVKGLNVQITETSASINKTTLKIKNSQDQIASILRLTYQEDKKSLMQILLEGNLSDFFSNLTYLENLNSSVTDLLDSTKNLNNYLTGQKTKMDGEVDSLQKTIALQNLQKQQSAEAKKEQEQTLKLTEAQYQQQLKDKKDIETKAAAIRARLFQMVGVTEAPTFEQALEIAKGVAGTVGIRPAFLLAIISQESAIGKNVGQCVLVDSSTGAGKRISSGATVIRVMKPTRDVEPFIQITTASGRDPYKTPVSCWIPVYYKGAPSGWGGAMGPAQFIPSTWNLFTDRLKTILGKAPDPWAIKDSFTASALYLSDLGASAQTTTKESSAAARYYGAAGSYNSMVMKRATCIQSFIDTSTMTTTCQNLIF